jgi:amino acid adenylation domain-containing protein
MSYSEAHGGTRQPDRETIQRWLSAALAERLGDASVEIDIAAPFASYGLDSVDVVSMIGDLEDWLGRSLDSTLTWDYPSVSALADYLAGAAQPAPAEPQPSAPTDDPIAIIGMSCRLPGANTLAEFWDLLAQGAEAIGEIPAERWSLHDVFDPEIATPGKMYTRAGGFLDQIDQFDAAFFGVSPREAVSMDPQQRLLLELAWEALEHAGLPPADLAGSATGVYIGVSVNDYGRLLLNHPAAMDVYASTGSALSIAAMRLSYLLDLRGPSLAIDTACSSALVSMHTACQSLKAGACSLALVGAANLIVLPDQHIAFSQARMMSPSGHCRTFDAGADGYVRSEGAGMLVLKRLSDALAAGDRVLALIRGSAINQDGKSNGLTAPNGAAQQAVIRAALADAGLSPADLSYVEAHGTGTPLGDPIEVNALKAVLDDQPAAYPCWIGSVKTNIGHLESAAGIAGVIKTILAFERNTIPQQLHFNELNPHISLAGTRLRVADAPQPWPAPRRIAGVSAFSFGGTNGHIVLEAPPPAPAVAPDPRSHHLLTLSARSPHALRALAERYVEYFARHAEAAIGDVCWTAQTGRTHFPHRLAVVGDSLAQLSERLQRFTSGQAAPGLVAGEHEPKRRRTCAFLFTGQGSQYAGMGQQLYTTQPVFRQALDRCAEILRPLLDRPLLSLLWGEHVALLDQTIYTQPALFALEYALAALWRSWGVVPDALMGHSLGEYVAACVAGVFSLEEGLELVALRGRLMQALPPDGSMAQVRASEATVRAALSPYQGQAAIAAINGPDNIVISGARPAVEELRRSFETAGLTTHALSVSHAFHSPLMDSILDAFERAIAHIQFRVPQIPLISNVTGRPFAARQLPDARYWRTQLRETVQFAAGLSALAEHGYEFFLEIGPHPTLSGLGRRQLPDQAIIWLPSLHRDQADWHTLLSSVAAWYVHGQAIDWTSLHQHAPGTRLALPTYPFERKRYWIDVAPSSADRAEPQEHTRDMMESSQTIAPSAARQQRVLSEVQAIIAPLLHIAPADLGGDDRFLDIGADSLVLLEAIRAMQSVFAIQLSPRQLFEELDTPARLAAYIEQALPADHPLRAAPDAPDLGAPLQTPAQPAAPVTSPAPALADATTLERVMSQQLQAINQVIAQQLDVLRQSQTLTAAPVATSNGAHVAPHTSNGRSNGGHAAPPTPAADNPPTVAFSAFRPITPGPIDAFNPQQQQHFEALRSSYLAQTHGSREWMQRYRPVFADYRNSVGFRLATKELQYPIVATRAAGARFWDIDGREWLDLCMGFGVNLFGHSPSFITAALHAQLDQGMMLGPQPEIVGRVSQLLCELTGMDRAAFFNSGSEAVMAALRLARAATRRAKIVMFAGAYHGTFDGILARYQLADGAVQSVPIAPGTPQGMVDDVLVLNYGSAESLRLLRAHAHELAAVLVEPVQSRRPDLQPREYLQQLRAITAEAGALLIFDEVITGFRIHPGGAQAWFGIQADLATYGKIVGGGLPIGVVAGRAPYMDTVDGGDWSYGDTSYPRQQTTFTAGTFCKHPLAMAGALAVLEELKRQGPALQQQLNQRTAALVEQLNTFFVSAAVPIHMVHFGSLFRFTFPGDLDPDLFFAHLLRQGVYVWEGRNCLLSTAHSDADIAQMIAAVKQSVAELRAGGFLSGPELPPTGGAGPSDEPSISREFGLTDAQQHFWLMTQMDQTASIAGHESVVLRLEGPLQVAVMQAVVQQVVDRHEALRTTFTRDGRVQQVAAARTIEVALIDLSHLAADERAEQLQQLLTEQNGQPFDLVHGPLLRCSIIRAESERHLLALTIHHLVIDGWSLTTIVRELDALYTAACQGLPARLAPPMQFHEYAAWEARQRQSAERQARTDFWLRQFADTIPVIELPTDRPRPPVKTYAGAKAQLRFEPALTSALKQVSRQQRATLFMTLFASFNLLLHRLSGQTDLAAGVPVTERELPGSDTLVGYCINIMPIRTRLTPEMTFAQLLALVQRTMLESYEQTGVPFGTLVKQLNPERDPSQSPLVSIAFNFDPALTIPQMGQLSVDLVAHPISFTQFDLFLNASEIEGELRLDFLYNTDLFDHATIQRWMRHFRTLVERIIDNLDQRVDEIALLTEAEQRAIVQGWNMTQRDYPRDESLHGLFEARAAASPDAIAVRDDAAQLSYRELNERANQLARHLHSLGAGDGALVGLCVERSVAHIVGLLGILKAGGAYVPLDPGYPQERLALMMEDARLSAVLTQQRLRGGLPAFVGPIVELDADWGAIARCSGENLPGATSALALACVMYTSGSTGRPKGIGVPHRAVTRLVCNTDYVQFGPTRRIAHISNTSFDAALFEIWGALLHGAQLVIFGRDLVLSTAAFAAQLQAQQIDTLFLTTALFHKIAQEMPQAFASLSDLLVGGEALDARRAERVLQLGAPRRLWNAYGPTESVTFASSYLIQDIPDGAVTTPIGRPIANTRLYILDGRMQPAPIGVGGELYIGGDGLAWGYLGRPALTASTFVPDPFSTEPGARLYRTGDYVRSTADGAIEFLARVDQQVKLRGFRIELGEIEAVLAEHPAVRDVVVIARKESVDDQRLVAYVVAEEPRTGNQELGTENKGTREQGNKAADGDPSALAQGATLQPSALRAFLTERLPEYMVPAAFVFLPALPINANGKLDRAALPAPDSARPELADAYVAPRTSVEAALAEIWADVLGLDRVGVHDHFFALGGHSLLATQALTRVRELYRIELPLGAIFERPTVAAFSQIVVESERQQHASPMIESQFASEREAEQLLAQLDSLSDDDMDMLLDAMLTEEE